MRVRFSQAITVFQWLFGSRWVVSAGGIGCVVLPWVKLGLRINLGREVLGRL